MLKPTDMTIAIDSREQTPLNFLIKGEAIPTVTKTLTTGDYSLLGFEDEIAIERKSLPDLLGCIGKDRERFERELQRMKAYTTRALVIESSWREIEAGGYPRSKLHPNSVVGSLLAWMERYQIPILMTGNHERAGLYVARMLYTAAKTRYAKYSQCFAKSG